jgi:hypothetical protein
LNPRARFVYRAVLRAVLRSREGGWFRISLTDDAPTRAGKTTGIPTRTTANFATLVPNEQVVEVVEFETTEPTCAPADTPRWR